MYDICHPVYYNISQLGCDDQVKITTAFYVYMELCEVKKLWDVNYHYNSTLDLVYLSAKKKKDSESEIYLPWPTLYDISINDIENMQEHLETQKFIFVFREGDSSSVYYKISAGLAKPLPPEASKLKKQKDEKKFDLEKEIRRNTSNLFELAKSLKENKDAETTDEKVCESTE